MEKINDGDDILKVLVTGGFGYLGSYCSQWFQDEKYEVTILARRIPDYMSEWAKKFNIIIGDIIDDELIHSINENFDVVIHFAAANDIVCKINPREALDINAYGTRNLLDICMKKNIKKFIYISTFHVYGANVKETITEEIKLMPVNDYGLTHYFAELYCEQFSRNSELSCIVLRPSNFYTGPLFNEIDRWSLVPNNFIMQILNEGKITINSAGTQIRNFISIKDLYKAITIVMNKNINSKFSIFNVGSQNYFNINDIAEKVQKQYELLTSKSIDIHHNINPNAKNEEVNSYVYDSSRLISLGYANINNIDNEIRDTIVKCTDNI